MTLELTTASVVICIFLVHTILSHLFNWWIRDGDGTEGVGLFIFAIEIIAVCAILDYLL